MFAAVTQLRSCISPQAPRTCGRFSAATSVPVSSRKRPTSALIDSNICRTWPCVVRRSCSSLATAPLTRSRFCAIGSSDRLISSVRRPSSPSAVARSASRCAVASFSTCSVTWRSASAEIAFICSANCARLPATRAIFSSVAARNAASCSSCADSRWPTSWAACSASRVACRRAASNSPRSRSAAARAESTAPRSRGTRRIAIATAPATIPRMNSAIVILAFLARS
jgi:hypothetical protein